MRHALTSKRSQRVLARGVVLVLLAGSVAVSGLFSNPSSSAPPAVGTLSTIAGTDANGFLATDVALQPTGLAFRGSRVAVSDPFNYQVRSLDPGKPAIFDLLGRSSAGGAGDGGPAVEAQAVTPAGLAFDAAGNLYVADSTLNRVRRIANDASGTITTVAGGGTLLSDNVPATQALLASPTGVAVDSTGALFISDTFHHVVRRVVSGTITTVAGTGAAGFSGDGGPGPGGQLNAPSGLAIGPGDVLFIADTNNNRIRRLSGGTLATVVGDGVAGFSGDGGPGSAARVDHPRAVAVDANGTDLLVVDTLNDRIRQVAGLGTGIISTLVGTGVPGFLGDGGPGTLAQLLTPTAIAVTPTSGRFFIADTGNNRVRERAAGGVIATVAGNGSAGFSGNNKDATQSQLNFPTSLAPFNLPIVQDASFGAPGAGSTTPTIPVAVVADTNNNLVRVLYDSCVDFYCTQTQKFVQTIAGGGASGLGDGGLATVATLKSPRGVAADARRVYIADTFDNRIRAVDFQAFSAGGSTAILPVISTVVGSGAIGSGSVPGPAATLALNHPFAVAVDPPRHLLYVADTFNHRVLRLDLSDTAQTVSLVAGTGAFGYNGDGIPAVTAQLNTPSGLSVDGAGNLYIADTYNFRIRKVDLAGVITTVAGTGAPGYNGDGRPATSAQLNFPYGVTADTRQTSFNGPTVTTIYIADTDNARIRRIDAAGTITTIAGTGFPGFVNDGLTATIASVNSPHGTMVDSDGNVLVADSCNNRVRSIAAPPPPIASLIVTNLEFGPTPRPVTFDDSGSSAPAGSLVRLELDFGDGTPHNVSGTTSNNIPHTYVSDPTVARLFTATLTVTDNLGRVRTATQTIFVPADRRPVASLSRDTTGGRSFVFSVNNSTDPDDSGRASGRDIVTFSLDFGDGQATSGPFPGPATINHTYAPGCGIGQATLTVTDRSGLTGTATASITCQPVAALEISPSVVTLVPFVEQSAFGVTGTMNTGDTKTFEFRVSNSEAGSSPITTFELSITDQTSQFGSWPPPGNIFVTINGCGRDLDADLVITDTAGNSSLDRVTILCFFPIPVPPPGG